MGALPRTSAQLIVPESVFELKMREAQATAVDIAPATMWVHTGGGGLEGDRDGGGRGGGGRAWPASTERFEVQPVLPWAVVCWSTCLCACTRLPEGDVFVFAVFVAGRVQSGRQSWCPLTPLMLCCVVLGRLCAGQCSA
jgi:hypothetical protein